MSEQPNQIEPAITLDIACPNCDMKHKITIGSEPLDTLYNQCSFCNTLYRYTKDECRIIIPAERQHYLTVRLVTDDQSV